MAAARAMWGLGSLAVHGSAALRLRRGAEQAEQQEGPVAGRRHTSCGWSAGPLVRGSCPCCGRALERGRAFRPRRLSAEAQIEAVVRGTCRSVPVASASHSQPPPLLLLTFTCVLFGDSFYGLCLEGIGDRGDGRRAGVGPRDPRAATVSRESLLWRAWEKLVATGTERGEQLVAAPLTGGFERRAGAG